jgi:hypothetical protein
MLGIAENVCDYTARPSSARCGADFDQTLGDYLTSNYRRVGPLIPDADLDWQLRFTLWERQPAPH